MADDPTTSGRRRNVNRRRFLAAVGATGTIGLAGCSGGGDGGDGSDGGGGDGGGGGGGGGDGGDGGMTTTQSGGDVTTLQFWELFSGGDGDAFESIINKFNAEHDDIQVEPQHTEWNQYYGKLFSALTGGNPPDLCIIHTTRLLKYAEALVDLSDYLQSDTSDAYVDKIWQQTKINGRRVSLPLDTHPCGLYYNKDIFEEAGLDSESPPTNWEEFKSAADTITSETDKLAFVPQPYQGPSMLRTWFAFLRGQGGQLLNQDRSGAAFNNDMGLELMKTWKKMTGNWGWDEASTSANRGTKAFRNGNAAMIYQGTWYVTVTSQQDYDWGMSKPFIMPNRQNKVTWANSHSFGVPKNPDRSEEKTKAAVRANEWLTQNTKDWGAIAGHLPAASSVLEGDALQNSDFWDVTLKKYMEMANAGQLAYLPRTENQSEYKRPIYKNVQQVYSQQKEPQKALNDAATGVNNALQ